LNPDLSICSPVC